MRMDFGRTTATLGVVFLELVHFVVSTLEDVGRHLLNSLLLAHLKLILVLITQSSDVIVVVIGNSSLSLGGPYSPGGITSSRGNSKLLEELGWDGGILIDLFFHLVCT